MTDPGSQDIATRGRELFHLLIEPVDDLLDRTKQLVVVADKALNELPFGLD